jgi:phospholipase/lecithinase/hemolysin
MRWIFLKAMTVILLALQAHAVQAGQFNQIVAFGDSLTDVGNVYLSTNGTFPAAPPYAPGRYTDGPVWVEQLASGLGLPALQPALAGGTDFAFGGAETHSASGLSTLGTPNLDTQIGLYLNAASSFTSRQLIVLWGGANDFLQAGQTNPSVPVTNLGQEITTIAQHGGQYFLVPNLPPLGDTPDVMAKGPAAVSALNALSLQFNSLLAAEEAMLSRTLGITIYSLDVAALFNQVVQNPSAFGLTNVTGQAVANGPGNEGLPGPVAANPDQYFFWDGVHPTETIHRLLGNAALAQVDAVPEPSSLTLGAIAATIGLASAWRLRLRSHARAGRSSALGSPMP